MPTASTARREELLDALVQIFVAEGFRHFTLEDLTRRLHCSKTTLYDLGHSKEQVTINVLVRFFANAAEKIEQRTAQLSDPQARITGYLRAVADELRPASSAFITDIAAHPATRRVYEQNTAFAAERVRVMIAEGVASGDFRAVHAAFVADTVASTMSRIQSGEIGTATCLSDAELYDELAALVIQGIRR